VHASRLQNPNTRKPEACATLSAPGQDLRSTTAILASFDLVTLQPYFTEA